MKIQLVLKSYIEWCKDPDHQTTDQCTKLISLWMRLRRHIVLYCHSLTGMAEYLASIFGTEKDKYVNFTELMNCISYIEQLDVNMLSYAQIFVVLTVWNK